MNMNEIVVALQKEFQEEMDGAVKYHEMALAAKKSGFEIESAYIMDMAIDEMHHVEWIKEFLDEKSAAIPEDVRRRYMAMKEAHKF